MLKESAFLEKFVKISQFTSTGGIAWISLSFMKRFNIDQYTLGAVNGSLNVNWFNGSLMDFFKWLSCVGSTYLYQTDKYSQHRSIIFLKKKPVWLNGWVFVSELSGYVFESPRSHLIDYLVPNKIIEYYSSRFC